MALQIRRGLNSERLTKVLQNGEIAWTTDTKKLYIGDGVTTGGTNILQSAQGVGLSWNPVTEQLDLTASTLFINSSNVTETTNLFHTAQRAQDAAAALFTNAAGDHVGISFVYDGVNHKLTATITQENVEDKVGAVLVAGNATNTGITFTYDATADANNRINAAVDPDFIQDQVNNLFSAGTHTGITFTYDDIANKIDVSVPPTPLSGSLAGNINLNTSNITGIGNISIIGTVNATSFTGSVISQNITPPTQAMYFGTTAKPVEPTIRGVSGAIGLTISNTSGAFPGVNPSLRLSGFRGTHASPTIVQNGDHIGTLIFAGYTGASSQEGYGIASFIASKVNDAGSLAGQSNLGSDLIIGNVNDIGTGKYTIFGSAGKVTIPQLQLGTYTVSTRPTGAVGGTIIFVSDASAGAKFQGWDGSAWVNLG